MGIRNADVARAWHEGRRLLTRNFGTDGVKLYSYRLLIGERLPDGRRVLYDFTSRGLGRVSVTTSHHVQLAKGFADVIVSQPAEYMSLKGSEPSEDVRRIFLWCEGKAYSPRIPHPLHRC